MQSPRNPRFTIRQFMIVIAGAALLLALPRMVEAQEPFLACLAAMPTILVLLHYVIEQIFGAPCPVCSRWACGDSPDTAVIIAARRAGRG